ncbi:MAG TPA: hypothetical protein VKY51_03280 [Fredinandcohnia sp.]|nr:hypothetical protein [Fredinandcohnia sp.]
MRAYRLVVLGLLFACQSPEDRAAKERIFSPEDPPRVLLAAQEVLQPEALDRPAMAERILSISAREAAFRIGPHRQEARTRFRWTRGERKVSLDETRLVAVDPGGDFHVLVENDQLQGMEWIRLDGISYARSRYAPFRERRRDRGSSEHVLDEAYRTLPSFHRLVRGAVKFTAAGTEKVEGREAYRYQASLGSPRAPEDRDLPPVVFPEGGPDEDTRLRLRALETGEPTAVSGTLWVDRASGVPLKAELDATLRVPDPEGAAELVLSIRLTTSKIGEPLGLKIPDHLEDAPRPPGPVAILEAYGFSRRDGSEDGGEGESAEE